MKSKVRVLLPAGYGLNCDAETIYAFERAGAAVRRVPMNLLFRKEVSLRDHQVLVLMGGFGWGDDHGAGVIQAVRFRTHLGEELEAFIAAGGLVIGICNGFQALVNLGLLPGFDGDYRTRSVALLPNDCGVFRDQWVRLAVDPASPCVFTRGLEAAELPVRHGEGKFFAAPEVIARLRERRQIVLRYALPDGSPAGGRFPDNPNGSVEDIAGICDTSGRIFGLMPHPEAFNDWTNHPDWPRLKEKARRSGKVFGAEPTVGLRIFENAVRHVRAS